MPALDLLQDGGRVPTTPLAVAFDLHGGLRLAEHPWNDGLLGPGVVDVLLDLDAQNFRFAHLLVQELDDAPQFARDRVSHEHEAQPTGSQVGMHPAPEVVGTAIAEGGAHLLLRIEVVPGATGLEALAHVLGRPRDHPVGGVVEHLRDDVAASARILSPLDLDQRRYAVGVHEQVVERPAAGAVSLLGHGRFALDQQPSLAALGVVPGEHLGVIGDQLLEEFLGLVRRLSHRDERCPLAQVDAGHEDDLPLSAP